MDDVFFEIHRDIPREGPGDSDSTIRALSMLHDLRPHAAILDVGCGPGMQTLDLLAATDASLIAVDTHQPYLDRLLRAATQRGFTDRLQVVHRDMAALDFPPGRFDLIWAEGSAYVLGFRNALQMWRPFLRSPGYLAATELTWLRAEPPAAPREFFEQMYPPMQDIDANLADARAAGYEPLGHFVLPKKAWWSHYYTPIESRLAELRPRVQGSAEALEVLALHEREIALYREYSAFYGYVFYVLRRAPNVG